MKRLLTIISVAAILLTACGKSGSVAPDNTKNTDGGNTNTGGNNPPVLAITSFTPQSASPGNVVTITGTAFGTDTNAVAIKFGNSATRKPRTISSTQITVIVPNDAQTGKISVTINNSTVASSTDFTFVKPDNGNGGTTTPTAWTYTNYIQTYDAITLDEDDGKLNGISATREAREGEDHNSVFLSGTDNTGNGTVRWIHASIATGTKFSKYACQYTFVNNNSLDATAADTGATATKPYLKVSFVTDAVNKKITNYYMFFNGKVGLTTGTEFQTVPDMNALNSIVSASKQKILKVQF